MGNGMSLKPCSSQGGGVGLDHQGCWKNQGNASAFSDSVHSHSSEGDRQIEASFQPGHGGLQVRSLRLVLALRWHKGRVSNQDVRFVFGGEPIADEYFCSGNRDSGYGRRDRIKLNSYDSALNLLGEGDQEGAGSTGWIDGHTRVVGVGSEGLGNG
jgi:hypothetical protein